MSCVGCTDMDTRLTNSALNEVARERGLVVIHRERHVPGSLVSADMYVPERVIARLIPVRWFGLHVYDRCEELATEDLDYPGEWIMRRPDPADEVHDLLVEARRRSGSDDDTIITDDRRYYW